MLDILLRAETRATYIDWLTTPQVRAIIGDLRARDDNGDVLSPAALRGIPGNVDLVQWDVGQIVEVPAVLDNDGNVITPAVTDPQAWIHVRLSGDAEVSDFAGPPGPNDFDRWEHSKMVKLLKSGGTAGIHRGVTTLTKKAGNAKDISVFRGSEMETTIKFHEFLGGNRY